MSESPVQARGPRLLWVVIVLVVLGGLAAWGWSRLRGPVIPSVDITGTDQEVQEAITSAREGVRRESKSARAWGRLGMVLRANNYGAEAIVCFTEAQSRDPQDPRWPYLLGLSTVLTDPEKALPQLRRAAELSGDEAPRLRLAETLLGLGQLEEAEDAFRASLSRAEHPRARLGLAQVLAQRGDAKAALGEVRRSLDRAPQVRSARILLAELLQRQGDPAAAAREARAAVEGTEVAWPDPYVEEVERLRSGVEARLAFVGQLQAQGRFAEALDLLGRLVIDAPSHPRVWHAQGRGLLQLGRLPECEKALRKAVEFEGASAEAWFDLGVCLQSQRQHEPAVEAYGKVLTLNPSHAVARYNLGLCRQDQGDDAAAERAFREALRYAPGYLPGHVALCSLLLRTKRFPEARTALEVAQILAPEDARLQELFQEIPKK